MQTLYHNANIQQKIKIGIKSVFILYSLIHLRFRVIYLHRYQIGISNLANFSQNHTIRYQIGINRGANRYF